MIFAEKIRAEFLVKVAAISPDVMPKQNVGSESHASFCLSYRRHQL